MIKEITHLENIPQHSAINSDNDLIANKPLHNHVSFKKSKTRKGALLIYYN